MTATPARETSAQDTSTYEVGYGKPPRHRQFRKGQSGNPGGRPRGMPVERANALLLEEAYRPVAIKENGRMVPVTAMQALLRSQMELAINGNYRAQRDILKAVQDLEILKSVGEYDDQYIDEPDEADEGVEVDESYDAYESGEADEIGESGVADESSAANETGEADKTGEGDETASDGAGTVVTAAPEAPPPLVDSALPRPAPSRRRTSASPGMRGGRRTAAAEKRATAGGQPHTSRAEFHARIRDRRNPESFPVNYPVLRESAGHAPSRRRSRSADVPGLGAAEPS